MTLTEKKAQNSLQITPIGQMDDLLEGSDPPSWIRAFRFLRVLELARFFSFASSLLLLIYSSPTLGTVGINLLSRNFPLGFNQPLVEVARQQDLWFFSSLFSQPSLKIWL